MHTYKKYSKSILHLIDETNLYLDFTFFTCIFKNMNSDEYQSSDFKYITILPSSFLHTLKIIHSLDLLYPRISERDSKTESMVLKLKVVVN